MSSDLLERVLTELETDKTWNGHKAPFRKGVDYLIDYGNTGKESAIECGSKVKYLIDKILFLEYVAPMRLAPVVLVQET